MGDLIRDGPEWLGREIRRQLGNIRSLCVSEQSAYFQGRADPFLIDG